MIKTKQTQTLPAIANAAADVLLVFLPDLMDVSNTSRKATEHRYMVFSLMEKAGYTHQQIADFFNMNRENVTKALTKLEGWLNIYKDLKGTFERLVLLVLKQL